ncbi:Serine/threonine protein kinase [hydrothermal vent metagenome]|uniref:Serine/threonine protein kinase n=1 Tax=hydrothermal vent metagenome TaxID=652676 RepID=A0A3B0V7Y9_9ZZZZ
MSEEFLKIPNFKIIKEIGRGGMAKVYLGEQLQPRRKVAIKIVSPSNNDPKILEDLKGEGDTVAQFNHPNIVTVFACGVVDKNYYLAMEILPGGDLKQKLGENTLDDTEVLQIMRDMSSALAHSHARKTLHRDIKPENIMFNAEGKAVLLDFGIAKAQGKTSEFTRIGAVVGTPHYMSPERALGKETDERSDLYALGVVMYEMLVGKKLFEGDDTFAISYAHVHEPPPALPATKSTLQPILDKLLAKDADDRYQSAEQLTIILDKWIRRLDRSNAHTTQGFAPVNYARSSSNKIIILSLSAVIAFGIIGFGSWYMLKEKIEVSNSILTQEQKFEMSDKLAAASSFRKNGKYKSAKNLYITVLTQFDCHNQESRRYLGEIDKKTLNEILANCPD